MVPHMLSSITSTDLIVAAIITANVTIRAGRHGLHISITRKQNKTPPPGDEDHGAGPTTT